MRPSEAITKPWSEDNRFDDSRLFAEPTPLTAPCISGKNQMCFREYSLMDLDFTAQDVVHEFDPALSSPVYRMLTGDSVPTKSRFP